MPPYVGQYCCPISFLLSLQGKEEESERESTVQKVEDCDPYLMKIGTYFVISLNNYFRFFLTIYIKILSLKK